MKLQGRPLFLLTALILGLASCTQLDPAPPTSVQGAAAEPMPLPAFSFTYSGPTRGFWFQAPVDFRITGLRVPDEAGHGLQNVEVFKLDAAPPQFPETASGGQVFYKTGVTSGEIIATDLTFAKGDFVGILGAAGDVSAMANSYGNGDFSSEVLGETVTLERFLTQTNLVASGGNQPYSSETGGSIARVEVYVAALETIPPTISLTTPADGASYQQGEAVTVSYSCADEAGGSGLKNCTGTLENGSTLDTSIPGSYSFVVDAEDNSGKKASLTHSYTVAAKVIIPELYTIDLETAPLNKILYSVKVGSGISYTGSGTVNTGSVRVDGYQYKSGKRFGGNQVKSISVSGDKVLTVVKAGTNTPNPTGGELDIKPAQSFGGPSLGKNGLVTLKSITVSGVSTNGAKLILYGNGQPIKTISLAKISSQTLTLDEPNVGFIQVRANDSFTVDDVVFEAAAKRL